MAPLVVKGQVSSSATAAASSACADGSPRSKRLRARSCGAPTAPAPIEDVLIGPDFKPFYACDRGTDLGITTWPGEGWRTGGGTVWGWISYDPNRSISSTTARRIPAHGIPSSGPATTSGPRAMFARRRTPAKARWFYQTSPHDLYDHDGVNELVLADLRMPGGIRKVAMRADRNGLLYVIDRTSGEVLSATPFGYRELESRRRHEDRPAHPGRREDARSRASSSATSARPRPA